MKEIQIKIYFEETKTAEEKIKRTLHWSEWHKNIHKNILRICQPSKETGKGMATIKTEHTGWRGQGIKIKPVNIWWRYKDKKKLYSEKNT